ncbi:MULTISPECIES: hypothetical protein [unclassified Rhizobium]|uniref:hypothetical protein n=1 Tax=unclassified Rhizobium TaxID=2613769 RepID=UPI0006FACCF3|nr:MULTISPECIES: hypothetical protein [unclassified Rhizobium]KQV44125.1 biotin transporter BioY [Rhizobium sp. Root1212]KRD38306.1 biotin transporter BioY [Rhizobium sp. Root268]
MSGLETAIRQALERSDRTSPEMRARIYQSARNALEAGLRKQDVHDPEVIAQQRHRLEVLIHAIETEERTSLKKQAEAEAAVEAPATQAAPPRQDEPSVDSSLDIAPDRRATRREDASPANLRGEPLIATRSVEPTIAPEPRLARDADDELHTPDLTAGDGPRIEADRKDRGRKTAIAVEKTKKRRWRSRIFSFLMVIAVLAAALGTAGWWVISSGLLQTAAERDGSVANPPASVRSEDFPGGLSTLGAQSGFSSDWISVYAPGSGDGPKAGARASADLVSDEGGQHLRMVSSSAEADGDIRLPIPASVLEQLSGKTSTIALTVQADMGKTTQFSVECDFSTLGECGRHRFTVNDEKIDMLFKVTFDRSLAPNEPGSIVLSSDVTGAGESLNLFAIRVLPGQ